MFRLRDQETQGIPERGFPFAGIQNVPGNGVAGFVHERFIATAEQLILFVLPEISLRYPPCGFQVGKQSSEALFLFSLVNVQEQSSDSVDSGKVISQSPEAGTSAASGSSVTITVSSGPDKSGQVQVPTLTGITQDEAQKLIEEAGLKLGKVTEVTNSDANLTGKVCSQSIDAGEYVDSGTAVDLEVSTGVGTYYYSGEIDAPTQAEDPNYTAGTAVQCTITDANGTQLYNQTVSGFPQPVGLTQITTATGTLTMAYYDTVPESTTTDENGNTVTTPASSNLVMFTRPLTFTAQQ